MTQAEVKPIPKSILQEAQEIIYGDRERTYGNPTRNIDLIAEYWSSHLSSKFQKNIRLTADDVCGMMILLKQARLATTPNHRDSLVDLCGYAALQKRIQDYRGFTDTTIDSK